MTRKRRWVRGVKTESTFPPPGLFNRDARTIARTLARRDVSPKGIGSGLRMLRFFIDRAGSGLAPSRRRELERVKKLLRERPQRGKQSKPRARTRARGRRGG